MKKLLVYVSIVVALSSCKTALFDALPGQEQKMFPAQLQGSYYVKVPSGLFRKATTKDTVFFEIMSASITTRDSANMQETKLDEHNKLQLVMKKYHVLATHSSEYQNYWEFSFIEETKRGLKIRSVLDEDKSTVLPKYFMRAFITVNNAGDSVFAYKTNDEQLVKYYEKVMRKKEALELVRIKK